MAVIISNPRSILDFMAALCLRHAVDLHGQSANLEPKTEFHRCIINQPRHPTFATRAAPNVMAKKAASFYAMPQRSTKAGRPLRAFGRNVAGATTVGAKPAGRN